VNTPFHSGSTTFFFCIYFNDALPLKLTVVPAYQLLFTQKKTQQAPVGSAAAVIPG